MRQEKQDHYDVECPCGEPFNERPWCYDPEHFYFVCIRCQHTVEVTRGVSTRIEGSSNGREYLMRASIGTADKDGKGLMPMTPVDRLRVAATTGGEVVCDDLTGDEAEIAALLLGRLRDGRKNYGQWRTDDGRDYPLEALNEAADMVMYLVAELVRLRRVRATQAETPEGREDEVSALKAEVRRLQRLINIHGGKSQ